VASRDAAARERDALDAAHRAADAAIDALADAQPYCDDPEVAATLARAAALDAADAADAARDASDASDAARDASDPR
jgi:hypothetical protein